MLDDGRHSLTITATAPGGTPSLYSPPLAIVVDTSAPDAPTAPVLAAGFDTGISAEDGITDKNVLQLAGTAEPGSVVALYNGVDANDDGKDDTSSQVPVPLQQVSAGPDGSYRFTTRPLPDGTYSFTVKAMDLAGNVSKRSAATSATVDTVAPAAPPGPTLSPGSDAGASHSDGLTDDATPVVTGTAEANSTVLLYDDGQQIAKAQANASGNYWPRIVFQRSRAYARCSRLRIADCKACGSISRWARNVAWRVRVRLRTNVAGGAITAPTLADGAAGRGGGERRPKRLLRVGGPGRELYDTDGVAVLGTAAVGANGKDAITSSSLSDGAHMLTVTDTDAAGNVSHASAPLAVTIDTLPPLQPTITSVTGALVSGDITPLATVNGTAEPGSTVQLVLDGSMTASGIFGESTAASDGDYSINSNYLPTPTATAFATATRARPSPASTARSNWPIPAASCWPPAAPTPRPGYRRRVRSPPRPAAW